MECGKQDDYTISGRSLCFECNEKNKVRTKKYYAENKEKIKTALHKDRQVLIKRGICVNCRKRNAAKGRQRCKECLSKALEATRRCQQKKSESKKMNQIAKE